MIVREMRDKKTPDYYEALRISSTADTAEIRRQYRVLSKQFHPDMGGSHDDMAKINEAYSVLSDPFRRSIYDAEQRRALHVPPRTPSQPVYTPPRRQPATRATQFATKPTKQKRRTNWWATLAWSFAAAVIVIGIMLQLPLAEAKGDTTTPATTSQPLTVNYPPDSSANSQAPTSYTAPDGTTYDMPAVTNPTTNSQSQQPNTTCSNNDCYSSTTCSDDSCPKQQTQSKKNCVTKTYGLYKHTVCSAPSGSNTCQNDTLGTYRYTTCD